MERINGEKVLFSWIHISDIHFLHGGIKDHVSQEMILKALINDINDVTNNIDLEIPKPDAIFLTGDIAYSGAEQEKKEYETAGKCIKAIEKSANLSQEDIFIIPGNHDIQRSIYKTDDDVAMLIDHLRVGRRDVEWALSKKYQHKRLLNRFKNFYDFVGNFAPNSLDRSSKLKTIYWSKTLNTTTGFSVRILGLNTALLSQNDEDKGELRLSLTQLKDFEDLQNNPNQLALAIGHHPFSWLADGKNAESWLRKKVHIYLSGHIHEPESLSYQTGGGAQLVHVQAGAIHGRTPISNSYNYSAVLINQDGQMALRVWTRIWSSKNKDFRDDPDGRPSGKLFAEYLLPLNQKTVGSKISIEFQDQSKKIPIKTNKFTRKNEFVTDSPPVIDIWVGRKTELSVISKVASGVVVITGIGGQGKSALASKYLDIWRQQNKSDFWDWRDCREQREQFRTKIVSIIEHFTFGEVSGASLEGAKIKDLVRIFFDVVRDYKGMIVLDNMDHYVDVVKNRFTLTVSDFVDGAIKYPHKLLIVLTCRPKINYASPRFHGINIEGITVSDTIELFKLRKVDIKGSNLSNLVQKIHSLTEGHPLWLNLIATQVATGLATLDEIINDLEEGRVDDRAKTMLSAIWKGLNKRQELILRSMAELTKPVEAEWIHMCVNKEIKSWNQFRRTFESLKSLSLVIESQDTLKQKEFDLHPIVRNFIRTEFYSKHERKPFLDRVIFVVNTVISKCGTLSFLTPLYILENLVLKAELELRKDDYKNSIISLVDVGEKLIQKGMPGELFRVGDELLNKCKIEHESLIDQYEFHKLNAIMAHAYAEYGREDEARKHLERYAQMVPNQTAQFISVCNAQCYVEWILKNYEEAIVWGKEGVRIKESYGIDTKFDCAHELALAQRDSGDVDEALKFFLKGFSVKKVVNREVEHYADNAPFFGNIGRCLQFKEKYKDALACFITSALLLEEEGDSALVLLNRGYAALWIGEVLESQEEIRDSFICYRQSEIIWSKRAPLKSHEPIKKLEKLTKKNPSMIEKKISEAGINRVYKQLLQKYEVNSTSKCTT